MTLAELIAAREDLHARHNAAVEAYSAEIRRLNAEIDAAGRAEQCARVERRVLARLNAEIDAAERTALHASVQRRMETAPLARRGLVNRDSTRWTPDAVTAREILGVTP